MSDCPINHHHVIPKSRGGQNTIPLCELCHSKAHNTDMKTLSSEGMERARLAGKVMGRPKINIDMKTALKMHKEGHTVTYIAKAIQVQRATLHRAMQRATGRRSFKIRHTGCVKKRG